MLTSMTDVTGHNITLTYVTASCYSVPVMSEYYTVGTPPDNDYIKRDFTAGISQTCYLSKIETDTEEVIFEMGSREDRYPGTTGKLTNMKIKSKLDGKDVYFTSSIMITSFVPNNQSAVITCHRTIMGRRLPYPPAYFVNV